MKENKIIKKIMATAILSTFATFAFADSSGGGSITNAIQWLIGFVGGPFGAGIATLSIMGCGIALWMNKLEKETFIKVLIGGGLVFGAAALARALGWGS